MVLYIDIGTELGGLVMVDLNRKTESGGVGLAERVEAFEVLCRNAGLKVTPQRVAVYKVLVESEAHPSAEAVWREVKKDIRNISLDTVNRTLLTLSKIDAAFIVEGSGGAKRFDGNLDDHQHFKCIVCKKIFDVYHEPFNNIEVPTELEGKFHVLRKTVYFEGFCENCKNRHKAKGIRHK